MKKKALATFALVMTLALVPTFAFAKKSPDTPDDGNSNSSVSTIVTPDDAACEPSTGSSGTCYRHSDTEVKTLADGTIISTTGATKDKSNTWYRLAVDRPVANGNVIKSNGVGGVSVGNVTVHFANNEAETAGLPEKIVTEIDALNSGKSASEVFGSTLGVDLSGYEKVGCTRAVILKDQTTGLTNSGTEFILEVSPLDPNGTYAVAYYDNHTGRWNFMPVTVDPVTKLIKMYLPGSCTIQLLKKV